MPYKLDVYSATSHTFATDCRLCRGPAFQSTTLDFTCVLAGYKALLKAPRRSIREELEMKLKAARLGFA